MKTKNEKISIIVPIYNGEEYLSECVKSILNQTYKNIEVILINDGSTDKTLQICNEYKKQDNRIVVIDIKNGGVGNARNIGIDAATGTYISFVDGDDILLPTFIEKLYQKMIEMDVDVVRCNYIKKNYNTGTEVKGRLYDLENKRISLKGFNKLINHFCTLNENIPCYVWLLLIKKNNIVKFNKTIRYMEDTEFTIRLLSHINSIYFLDEHLYIYRYNNKSASNNPSKVKNNIETIIRAGIKIKNDLKVLKIGDNRLDKSINSYLITTIVSKLKLINNYSNSIDLFDFLKNNQDLDNMLNNLNKKEISKKIIPEYISLKHKHYRALVRITKLKKALKEC